MHSQLLNCWTEASTTIFQKSNRIKILSNFYKSNILKSICCTYWLLFTWSSPCFRPTRDDMSPCTKKYDFNFFQLLKNVSRFLCSAQPMTNDAHHSKRCMHNTLLGSVHMASEAISLTCFFFFPRRNPPPLVFILHCMSSFLSFFFSSTQWSYSSKECYCYRKRKHCSEHVIILWNALPGSAVGQHCVLQHFMNHLQLFYKYFANKTHMNGMLLCNL